MNQVYSNSDTLRYRLPWCIAVRSDQDCQTQIESPFWATQPSDAQQPFTIVISASVYRQMDNIWAADPHRAQ